MTEEGVKSCTGGEGAVFARREGGGEGGKMCEVGQNWIKKVVNLKGKRSILITFAC